MIGIATLRLLESEGLGFAVPSYTAQHIADQIITEGKVSQGFLGVELECDETSVLGRYFDFNQGACIQTVVQTSPAEKAGLQRGDRILRMNDISIKTSQSLRNQLCVLPPDTRITLQIEREGDMLEIDVELGSDELSKRYSQLTYPIII